MGKIEGIFATNISGKVGNVVFRKNGKQNVVSQRPASVKNPRTDMQQRQRAYIKTVASAYSVLKPICDHSFEGVAYGANSMNFFKRENYKIVSNAGMAVLKNSSGVVVDASLLLSKGSIKWNSAYSIAGQIADISGYMEKKNIESIDQLTFGQFLDALNIKKGDQLTVVNVSRIIKQKYVGPNGAIQLASDIYYSRYILEGGSDSTKAFVQRNPDYDEYILNASILGVESEINTNAELVATPWGELDIRDINRNSPNMYAAIISRRYADNWLRSTETLTSEGFEEGAYSIESVLPSYSPTGERYLNNAEK
mgnify:CR=1 FL=1